MNPFLESTVATPQPEAQWNAASSPPSAPPPSGQKPPRRQPGSQRSRSGRPRRSLRRPPGLAMRLCTMAASLLLPVFAHAVDINAASVQQLQEVKGIGPKTAAVIIEERERGGPFASMTDVSERVKGIGPKKAASLEAAGLKVVAASGAGVKEAEHGPRAPRRNR